MENAERIHAFDQNPRNPSQIIYVTHDGQIIIIDTRSKDYDSMKLNHKDPRILPICENHHIYDIEFSPYIPDTFALCDEIGNLSVTKQIKALDL